ncbi:hypothetical protein Bca52824_016944 [Brassica carinata]|uniref:Uncharacterized protein n=1 Tax=Brassica carinata TaxID=52824 RepID=A0A8X8AWR3_BRACI|nr:hypothetical protein Bca52824_016944 [Brassica carinata]
MEAMEKVKRKIVEKAGEKLLIDPPCSVDELLTLLDDVLICLKAVKEDWPALMKKQAVYLLKKASMNGKLCRHYSQVDVKVAVAACISEIVRIVAPDAPYDSPKMKVPQASRRLAEKVLSNGANRLKTYLPEAVRWSGVPRENFSKIVVSICCPPLQEKHQLVVNEKEVKSLIICFLSTLRGPPATDSLQDSQASLTNEKQTRVQAFRSERSADETYNVSYLFRDEESRPKKTTANKKEKERLSKQ